MNTRSQRLQSSSPPCASSPVILERNPDSIPTNSSGAVENVDLPVIVPESQIRSSSPPPLPTPAKKARKALYDLPDEIRVSITANKVGKKEKTPSEDMIFVDPDITYESFIEEADSVASSLLKLKGTAWKATRKIIMCDSQASKAPRIAFDREQVLATMINDWKENQVNSSKRLILRVHYVYTAISINRTIDRSRPQLPTPSQDLADSDDEDSQIVRESRTQRVEAAMDDTEIDRATLLTELQAMHYCSACTAKKCYKVPLQTKHCEISGIGWINWAAAVQAGTASKLHPPDNLPEWRQYRKDVEAIRPVAPVLQSSDNNPVNNLMFAMAARMLESTGSSRVVQRQEDPVQAQAMGREAAHVPNPPSSPPITESSEVKAGIRWIDYTKTRHRHVSILYFSTCNNLRDSDCGYRMLREIVNSGDDKERAMLREYGLSDGFQWYMKREQRAWEASEKRREQTPPPEQSTTPDE